MLEVFEQLASGNAKHGFPRSRIVCRMDWAADSRLFVDNVIEFESRVNAIWHVTMMQWSAPTGSRNSRATP